ncbi:MAG TPA: BPSS1780 family membrane protein, partial [Usitatibacter sp.]|nr:BPSS1780 family membrane protein [Usitatibacter sp.]
VSGSGESALSTIVASSLSLLLGVLVALALTVPLLAAYWFAPALIVLNGMKAVPAMKASFHGCFRNLMPFLVYSIVMLVLAILAAIPVGLGFLVWIPLAISSTYTAYRGIFTDEEADAPLVTV